MDTMKKLIGKQSTSKEIQIFIKECRELLRDKNFEQLCSNIKAKSDSFGDDFEFLKHSANLLLKAQDFSTASNFFKKALAQDPYDVALLIGYASALTRLGDSEDALTYFNNAVSAHPSDRKLLKGYYNALVKQHKHSDAYKVAKKILDLGQEEESLFYRKNPLKLFKTPKGEKEKSLSLDPAVLWDIGQYLEKHPEQLLKIPAVRARLSRNRREKLLTEKKLKTLTEDENIIENAVVHNLEVMQGGADDGGRISLLVNPLAAIDYVAKNIADMKVLTIGPRSESELFTLMAAGFRLENITGIDLISYSPLIDHGDMHDLPYDNSEFDIVIAGWVLAYSTNNDLAAQEILRVCKPNGYLAVGSAYTPPTRAVKTEMTGTNIIPTRFSSLEDYEKVFSHGVQRTLFSGIVERERKKGTAAITMIMQKKVE